MRGQPHVFRMYALAAAVSAYMLFTTAHATVIYVDDSAVGANDGSSWQDAYSDLQDALMQATIGDELRLGQGVYKPAAPNGPREATFNLPNGAIVQGGYAGFGAVDPDALDPKAYPTMLSGDLNGDDGPVGSWTNFGENVYHIVTAASTIQAQTQLRGVTITAGNADLSDFPQVHSIGGGMTCLGDAGPSIVDCLFVGNRAIGIGGGLHSDTGSPLLDLCTFDHNRSINGWGGGLRIADGTLTNCTFSFNRTGHSVPTGNGGAIACFGELSLDNCVFLNNAGSLGCAVFFSEASATMTDCTFQDNGGDDGGAFYAGSSSQITATNCDFVSNSSCCFGGAIRITDGASATLRECQILENVSFLGGGVMNNGTLTAIGCLFRQNALDQSGASGGGGIRNTGQSTLVNCTFAANSSQGSGGGIFNTGTGTLDAINCLFAGNSTTLVGGALFNEGAATLINSTLVGNAAGGIVSSQGNLAVRNCILWDNTAPVADKETQQIVPSDSTSVSNSCIMGWSGALGGYGNFGADPLFIDADGPDDIYGTEDDNPRLSEDSPARDAGNNEFLPPDEHDLDQDGDTAEPIPLDLDLLPRIVSGVVDLGAYEFQGLGCPADIASAPAGDGEVNVDDLLAVVNAWGDCPSPGCLADITNDAQVDIDDLLLVILSWGPCS